MEETSRTGVPLMRPMFLEFPDQTNLALNDEEFMFGDSLLVAPKVWDFTAKYFVSLPTGDWYDFWTGSKVSGRILELNPGFDTLPVYVRAGSIIPLQPVVQNVEETPRGPLVLSVYPGPQCHGSIYADDGNTLAYQRGQNLHVDFTCELKADRLDVDISAPIGQYQPWFSDLQLEIYGVGGTTTTTTTTTTTIKKITADSQDLSGWKLKSGVLVLPSLKWAKTNHHVSVEFASK
jgi:alpha-glucosidase